MRLFIINSEYCLLLDIYSLFINFLLINLFISSRFFGGLLGILPELFHKVKLSIAVNYYYFLNRTSEDLLEFIIVMYSYTVYNIIMYLFNHPITSVVDSQRIDDIINDLLPDFFFWMLKTVEKIQDHYRPEKLGDMELTIVP